MKLIFLIVSATLATAIITNKRKHLQKDAGFSIDTACPAWYISTSDGCICGNSLGPLVKCHKNERVSIRIPYSMSYDNASAQVLVGNCPYVKEERGSSYMMQPRNVSDLNTRLCGWANRTGFLCSRCKEGLGVSVMTYDNKCLECIGKWRGWILYLFLAIAPTTIFFIFVISCKIRSTSGLNSTICLFQVLTFYADRYPNTFIRKFPSNKMSVSFVYITITVAGFWNLDFFRHVIPHFCISEDMTTLNVIAMEYIVAIYPMVLTATIYICIELYDRDFKPFQILWAPFKCLLRYINWNIDIRHSLIDAFATFLHLSYTKLIFVSFNLISYVAPYNAKGEHVYPNVLYYAGEVPYLSLTHLPYFILSISVLLVFVISPFLLLFFYPTKTFQKCLGLLPRVNWHPLHAFADAFNGCFKNGTNGTRDWRYFGSFYLLFLMVFYLSSVISEIQSEIIVTFLPLIACLMFGIFKPYKSNFFNIWDSVLFAICELLQIWLVYDMYLFNVSAFLIITISSVPFIYMLIFLGYKLLSLKAPKILEKINTCSFRAFLTLRMGKETITNNVSSVGGSRTDIEDIDLLPGHSQSITSSPQLALHGKYGSL